ncbi:hypothetical protein Ancab_015327 [Ancistrocladus abbreviatus]
MGNHYDVYGNLFGLLAAHPVTPFVTMHHLDVVEPIFPDVTRVEALQRLAIPMRIDSAGLMQQSICYDTARKWTVSVSWGFAVQIVRGILSPREMEMPTRTFLNWYKRADYTAYAFNTRPVARNPCQKPFVFYMSSLRLYSRMNRTVGQYERHRVPHPVCKWNIADPSTIQTIVVNKAPDPHLWDRSPRRNCCRILNSRKSNSMVIDVGVCNEGEIQVRSYHWMTLEVGLSSHYQIGAITQRECTLQQMTAEIVFFSINNSQHQTRSLDINGDMCTGNKRLRFMAAWEAGMCDLQQHDQGAKRVRVDNESSNETQGRNRCPAWDCRWLVGPDRSCECMGAIILCALVPSYCLFAGFLFCLLSCFCCHSGVQPRVCWSSLGMTLMLYSWVGLEVEYDVFVYSGGVCGEHIYDLGSERYCRIFSIIVIPLGVSFILYI